MPVYNSLIPYMRPRWSKRLLVGLCACLLMAGLPAKAADWTTAARNLAQQISAVTGPGVVALEINNRSSLAAAEVEPARNALISELRSQGIQIVESTNAAASVRVTFSENAQNYLWVAEIHQAANEEKVVMVTAPGVPLATSTHSASVLSIRRTLLLSQDAPILDATLLSGGTPEHLIVLEPERVVLYRNENGHWQPEQTFPVVHTRAWPRDLRGRVVLDPEHLFEAYLPGVICSGALTSTLSMNCHEADDPWPLGNRPFSLHAFFSPARNFFTGVVVPGIGVQNTFKPFYAAAPLPRESYVLWLLASVDGSSHLVDGTNDLPMERINWGSDLVSVKSSCGSGWQVLASSKGDRSGGDALRAFEIADRQPVPAGEPLNFAGLITALWSKEDGSSAIAVERNLETGNYDAFSLAIFCSQ